MTRATADRDAQSHLAAQALLAGLMQGIGEREKDEALLSAGQKLAEAAERGADLLKRAKGLK